MASSRRIAASRQVRRIWALVCLLSRSKRSWSVKELADQLGCSKSTVDRDLQTIEVLFPLAEQQDGVQRKRYEIHGSSRVLELFRPVGALQLLSLRAALAALAPLAGSPIHEDLTELAAVVRGALADRHNGWLDKLARVFEPHPRGVIDYGPHSETIDSLTDAIARDRVCRIAYRSLGAAETTVRDIEPRHMRVYQNALYVVADDRLRRERRTFAVHRIRSVEVTGELVPRARDDKARIEPFGICEGPDAPQLVEVRIRGRAALWVAERTLHPDEDKQWCGDELRYRVRTGSRWEVVAWVLSLGPDAELVAPAAWRDELAVQLARTAAQYEAVVGQVERDGTRSQ